GVRPHVSIIVPVETAVGVGHLPATSEMGGLPLPSKAVERILCDASVRRLIFGPNSEPLDIGRASRTFPAPMRAAIIARDRMCSKRGCDRPPSWCETHHATEWSLGGPTAASNGVLACDPHHDDVHHSGWRVRVGPSGRAEWLAPNRLDPAQRWRSN